MVQTRNQKTWLVVLGLTLAAGATVSVTACDDDGVTADCPAMPIVDENGKPVGETIWSDSGPIGGAGGALNRWREAAVKQGCATPIEAEAGSPGN